MAAQGTNEGGSNMNRGRNTNGSKGGYYGRRQNNADRPDSARGTRYDHRSENRSDNRNDNPRGDRVNRYSKPGQTSGSGFGGSGRYGKSDEGRTAKPERYDRNRAYNPVKFAGKDDDEDDNSRRSKPSRPKESKTGVSIPDKNKAMLRLEKEQKTIKKKQQSKKKESNRPQPKQKRANNVNYTKNYVNGDYDDYEDYYDL